jgi:solute:Na+ symporter, SSS family
VLLIGILWRRATGAAAFVALLCGIATAITLYALNQPAVYAALGWEPLFKIQEPFLYFSVWAFLVTSLVLVVLSLFSRADPADKLRYVFHRAGVDGAQDRLQHTAGGAAAMESGNGTQGAGGANV